MKTSLEKRLELEDLIIKEAKERFLELDPKWVVRRWMDHNYMSAKQNATAVAYMYTEVFASRGKIYGQN
jgi:hypothetical protein